MQVKSFIEVISPGKCSAALSKKAPCEHPSVYYLPAEFPPDWCGQGSRLADHAMRTCDTGSGPPALRGCAHLFVNFGQWPASECARGGGRGLPCNASSPWSVVEYRHRMRELVSVSESVSEREGGREGEREGERESKKEGEKEYVLTYMYMYISYTHTCIHIHVHMHIYIYIYICTFITIL